jgi:predicted ATP-grasp superfamily ATP-dependent carboligase
MKVLITGGRSPYTLDLIRLFKEMGHDIIAVDFFQSHLCSFSRHVDKSYVICAPNTDFQVFKKELIDIVKIENIELIIPTCEEVFHISKMKEELNVFSEVFCESFDRLISLHNKQTFIESLVQKNILAPKTFCLADYQNELVGQEVILKKKFSRFGCDIYRINADDISTLNIENLSEWIVQERVFGEELSVYTVVRKGQLQAISVYKKRYAIDSGATIFFEHFEHPGVESFVTKFFKDTQLHGQFSFDLIMNEKQKIYPIECNPRATSGVHLFNRRTEFVNAFTHETQIIKPKIGHQYMLSLAMVLFGWKGKDKIKFLKDFLRAEDVIFKWDDIKPSVFQYISFIHFFNISLRERIPLVAATTIDIEFNG